MGYTRNRYVTVSSWHRESIDAAHAEAVRVFELLASPIMESTVNSVRGFVVWTSGSKEGWPEDAGHLADIEALEKWLRAYRAGAEGARFNPLTWHVVYIGEEEGDEGFEVCRVPEAEL